MDPSATGNEKLSAVGFTAAGLVLPGNGQRYKQASEVVEQGLKKVDDVADAARTARKRGPRTDPDAPHNKKIREEGDKLADEGNTILAGGGREKERLVPTPGGAKDGRRPDILYETPAGEKRGRQVGKTKADGSPVKREAEALDDLNGQGGLPTDFVPYDR